MNDESIFAEAMKKKTESERQAYLDHVCAGKPELRARVEALLNAHYAAGTFLNEPAVEVTPTDIQPLTERPGQSIDRYKLLQQIGEGGFGVVYMAEQTQPVRRKVALKIIKPGMDTKDVIARFEAERQALSLMDHPNIAKVFDAGATASGRPYFVMELVKGVPITQFCDENSLSTKERLDLFVTVCRAVQHAHQKGIIHRDLKPSNVMVTLHDNQPVPKVIDFGVSKAISQQLTEKTLFTAFGQMIGTPIYMSPEQAQISGLDIDTRSDIYSLGVMLYELLTGTTPLDAERLRKSGYAEMQRLIREEEAPKPSLRLSTQKAEAIAKIAKSRGTDSKHLNAELRGDLDWIVMKALEKDRNRRYGTAVGFADDILRFVKHEAVEACPPSAGYRLKKYIRRHRKLIAAISGIVLALLIGTAVSAAMAYRATLARREAVNQKIIALDALDEAEKQALRADRARLESDVAQYSSQIRLADSNYSKIPGKEALEILRNTNPKIRGWEHDRLKAIWNARRRLLADDRYYESVAITSDGTMVAAGGSGNEVRLFDFETKTLLADLRTTGTRVSSLEFSADGKYLAATSDLSAHLWTVDSRQEVGQVSYPKIEKQTVSEQDNLGASFLQRSTVQSPLIHFAPKGEQIALVVPGKIEIWNHLLTNKLLEIPTQHDDETYAYIVDVAFHPQLPQLLVRRYVRFKNQEQRPAEDYVNLEFRIVDTGSGETLTKKLEKTTAYDWQRGSVQFEKSGRWFITEGGTRSPQGFLSAGITVRDPDTCQIIRTITTDSLIHEVMGLSEDGRSVIVSHGFLNGPSLYDVASGALSQRLSPVESQATDKPSGKYVSSVAISADGKRVVSGFSSPPYPTGQQNYSPGLMVWDFKESVAVKSLGDITSPPAEPEQNGVSFQTRFSAPIFPNNSKWFARVVNQEPKALNASEKLEISAKHPMVVYVEFLSLENGNSLFTLAKTTSAERISLGADLSDSGQFMACWKGAEIEIWDVSQRQRLRTLTGITGRVVDVLFDPQGHYLAATTSSPSSPQKSSESSNPNGFSKTQQEFYLWNLQTGKLVSRQTETATDQEQPGLIRLLAFSPDGKHLTRSRDLPSSRQEELADSRVTDSSVESVIELVETTSGKTIRQGKLTCTPTEACFHSSGTRLYYSVIDQRLEKEPKHGLWMWDLQTDQQTHIFKNSTIALRISPTGRRLMFMSGFSGLFFNNSMFLMETDTHQTVFEIPPHGMGVQYYFTGDDEILRYDPRKKESIERLLIERESDS